MTYSRDGLTAIPRFMITVTMKKSVETIGRTYSIYETYELPNRLASEFMTLGWASPMNESTALSPAKCRATKKRVCKR